MAGRAVSYLHVTPDFMIIGGGRCGSSALNILLRKHPNVMERPRNELHYFDGPDRAGGLAAYRRLFPYVWQVWAAELAGRRPTLTGEKTPSYLLDAKVPARVRRALPNVRLIALLREPAARAASNWNLQRHLGAESRSFEQALADELGDDWRSDPPGAGERLLASQGERVPAPRSYARRGLYQLQLERWHAQFVREQLLIVETEQLFRDTPGTMAGVHIFLGIPVHDVSPQGPRSRGWEHEPIDESLLDALRTMYRPHNERLAAYLGRSFSWS